MVSAFSMACSISAQAQLDPKAGPSPLAPGDLKTPIFNTITPVYNLSDAQAKSASVVVAQVDGRAITLGDVRDAIAELPPTMREIPFEDLFPGVVSQLIRQQALAIRAQRQALDDDPAIRRKMKAVSDRILGDELLRRETAKSITEAALLARYDKDIAGKPGPDQVHVRVIMVPTEQEATGIIQELRDGADFAKLAKRSSKDTSASVGGDAGFVTLDQLTSEVGAVVFAMSPGQFTPFPVRSVGAWFVLKVEERRHQPVRAFSVVRDELRQTMIREAAPDVVTAALAAVTVRAYDINGKETGTATADGTTKRQ